MDIRFNCPHCDQHLSVEEQGAGMIVSCPKCKEQIEIPVGTASQAPKVSRRAPASKSSRDEQRRPIKPVKLFFIVFAAILAAGAILLGGIYAKARLDEWQKAKWVYGTQAATATAAATVPLFSSSDASKAELRHTAIDRMCDYVNILENKPFGIPLTADEQQDLKSVKANIAKLTDETDQELKKLADETEQELNQTWAAMLNLYQRRADLSLNLVNTVADLAINFDQSMFVEATNVRTSVGRAQMQLDPNKAPTDAAQLEQFESAQGQLSNALSRLLLIVEGYPEWRASQYLLSLKVQLEGIEHRLSVERGNFNTAVQSYNSTLPSGSKPRPTLQKLVTDIEKLKRDGSTVEIPAPPAGPAVTP